MMNHFAKLSIFQLARSRNVKAAVVISWVCVKSYRVKVRSPREWGIDFSSKKKQELKKRNATMGEKGKAGRPVS